MIASVHAGEVGSLDGAARADLTLKQSRSRAARYSID
jgi:hypothetical protein